MTNRITDSVKTQRTGAPNEPMGAAAPAQPNVAVGAGAGGASGATGAVPDGYDARQPRESALAATPLERAAQGLKNGGEAGVKPLAGDAGGHATRAVMGIRRIDADLGTLMAEQVHELVAGGVSTVQFLSAGGDDESARVALDGLRAMVPSYNLPEDPTMLAGGLQDDREAATASVRAGDPEALVVGSMHDRAAAAQLRSSPAGHKWVMRSMAYALGNDLFASENDDDGFTNNVRLSALFDRRPGEAFELSLDHSMITEVGGDRRTDWVRLAGAYLRHIERGKTEIEWGLRAGAGVNGNVGGLDLQAFVHGLPIIDARGRSELQGQYPEEDRWVALVGGLFTARRRLSGSTWLWAGVDGEAAIGQGGVSYVRPFVGLGWDSPIGRLEVEAGMSRFFTDDPFLTIPGGFNSATGGEDRGFVATPLVRLSVPIGESELGFELRANEGGSGAPIGTLMLRIPVGD